MSLKRFKMILFKLPSSQQVKQESMTTLQVQQQHRAPTVSQIVTKPQSIKLDGETPTFGGKASTMSIDDWLFMVETKMKLGRVPNDTKIALLSSYLKGTALQLAKHFMDSDPENYEKFKEVMLKNYTPLDQNVEDRSAWHRLRQSDYESFEKYLEDFQFLANRLKASDESKLELLKSQLNHDFRLTLATNQTCKTLEDVIICCRKIAPFYEHKKKAHQINVVSKFQQRCRFCGKTNHKIEQCFKKRNLENRTKESSDRDKKTYNQKPYNRVVKVSDITCYKCKKPGHIAKNCRVKQVNVIEDDSRVKKVFNIEREDVDIPFVIGTINDIDMNLKIGLDSGACVSVLSKNIIRKLDLIEEPSDLEIKGVIGNTSKVLSMVKKVEINIQGYTCILDFVVLDHDSHDILLGIDWFKLSRAGLYPYLNLLRFPSGDVKLDNRKNETIEDNEVSLESIRLVEVPYDSEELLDTIEWNSKPSEVVPGLSLTKKDEILFFDLLKKNEGRFAHCNEDLDRCTVMPFTGRFETNIPVYTPAYRHSSLEEDIIDKEFESWLSAGIVVNSSSPWSSPVIVVPKKDGSHRVCIDYRRINKITIRFQYQILMTYIHN